MSFFDCLQTAVEGKELTQAEAENLFSRYDSLRRAKGGGPQADAEAKAQLAELLETQGAEKRRQALLSALHLAETDRSLDAHVNSKGVHDIVDAVEAKFEHFGDATFSSVEGQSRYIAGEAMRRMSGVVDAFRRNRLLGDNLNLPGGKRLNFRKNQMGLRNLTREAFGANTNDVAARDFFKQWSDSAEWLRQQFNAHGGAIPKIEGGWLPQSHDRLALLRAGRDAWKAYIGPRLDWDRMKHPKTGSDILPDEISALLDDVFDNITMEGWNNREAMRQQSGKGALANRYQETRFFHFKDADAYLAYGQEFGEGDVFVAMMGNISQMSRDIAMLKVLGPNPAAMVEFLKQKVSKELAGQGVAADSKIKKTHERLDTLYAMATGTANTPVSNGMAMVLGGSRNLITSAVLGSANITAISDLGFQAMARKISGMPQMKMFHSYVKYLKRRPQNEAVRAGLILDSALHGFHSQSRYLGMLEGSGITNYLADRTITLSGLSPFTQAGRHAFGMDMMGRMADVAGQPWGKLDKRIRTLFEQWGFKPGDWDKIRKSKLYRPAKNSASLLRPVDITDPALAAKWGEMVLMQTDFAVPTTSNRARAAVGQNRPGTIVGEAMRSFMQFMNFSFAFLMLQNSQINKLGGITSLKGASYAGQLLLVTSLYGALALQISEVIKGRDPLDMSSGKFWGAAAMKGGGLGLYGDFLFSGVNRFGGGLADTMTGPLVQRVNALRNLTIGNAMEIAQGKDPKIGRDLVNFARANIPGNSLWWIRAAGERIFLDQLSYLADPDAQQAFDRRMRARERDYGQQYFWKPGEMLPERGPNLGAALGNK